MKLSDIQREAVMVIGPCRIASLSLVALRHQSEEALRSELGQKALTKSVDRIKAAYALLNTGLLNSLEAVDFTLKADLETLRENCVLALEPLHEAVRNRDSISHETLADIPDLEQHCLHELEPKVSGFLDTLVQELSDAQRSRETGREESMLGAVKNAEAVGRNIKLIAFNASIEAARIGDQGKGFAVIATEIRGLADRTQSLLTEIAGFLRA